MHPAGDRRIQERVTADKSDDPAAGAGVLELRAMTVAPARHLDDPRPSPSQATSFPGVFEHVC
jgi:hypothetical protein